MKTGWENGCRVPVTDRTEPAAKQSVEERGELRIVRALRGLMLADVNPALAAECLALATGVTYDGDSEEEIARRHRVTRASVSKRCNTVCDALGVRNPRALRGKGNRMACAVARNISLSKQ